MKDWKLFVLLLSFLRGGKGSGTGGSRLMLVLILGILFFWLIATYVLVKLTLGLTKAIFVRDGGRQIYGGESSLIRRNTVYRGFGRTLDYALLSAMILLPIYVAQSVFNANISTDAGMNILPLAGMLYFPLITYFSGGTTFGKSLFGLEVTSTVGSLSLLQVVIREIVFLLSLIFWPLALYVVMKNKNEEQAGDIVADTLVIKQRPAGFGGISQFVREPLALIGSTDLGINRGSSDAPAETTVEQDETTLQQTGSPTGNSSQNQALQSSTMSNGGTAVYDSHACTACNKPCPESSAYCPHCGAEL